ncbi:uncharacterized protein LOC135484417 isoform X2 [Lineus longissimus]
MSQMTDRVIQVISKPPSERTDMEVELLLPWLKKRSDTLVTVDKSILMDIVRNCEYRQCQKDDVIIKQGDVGDCFYIMLSGKTSVYIDTQKSDDDPPGEGAEVEKDGEEEEEDEEEPTGEYRKHKDGSLDRNQFGKFIIRYDAGKSFGEIALMSKEAVRNASIVADDGTDLLVVSRLLFNRSLKSKQEAEYKERKQFIACSSLFDKWIPKFSRLLEMSLRKEVYPYGCNIVKQGDPVIGLHFIIKGQAKIIVDPTSHKTQFPKLMQEMERSEVDDLRSHSTNKKENDEIDRHDLLVRRIRVRRREGYAAAEKKMVYRKIDLCFVEEMEVIGDIEMVLNLPTYMHTIQCTANTEVLILDMKNYERLITRKNPQTIQIMKEKVVEKLSNRSTTPQGLQVPLIGHIVRKLKPKQKVQVDPGKNRQAKKREVLMKQLVKLFLDDKAPMIEPCVPNTVYYKTKAHEKAQVRKNVEKRQGRNLASANTRARLYGMNTKRPRSRRELENLASAYPTNFDHMDPYRRQSAIYVDEDHELDELLARDNIRTAVSDEVFKLTQLDSDDEGEKISKGSLINIVSEMDSYQRVTSAVRSKVVTAVAERENKHKQFDLLRPQSAPAMKFERKEEVEHEAEHEEELSLASEGEEFHEGDDNFDWETSDGGLRNLEDKVRRFVERPSEKAIGHGASIRPMRRFEIKTQADIPVPGGTVFVRRKECRFGATNTVGEHQHVRHFMLPKNAFQAIQLEKERMRHKQQYEEVIRQTPLPPRPRTSLSSARSLRTVPNNRKVRPHSAFVSRQTADAMV